MKIISDNFYISVWFSYYSNMSNTTLKMKMPKTILWKLHVQCTFVHKEAIHFFFFNVFLCQFNSVKLVNKSQFVMKTLELRLKYFFKLWLTFLRMKSDI